MASAHYETLFHRHPKNPILTANDWPNPVHTEFNAGATRLADGTTLVRPYFLRLESADNDALAGTDSVR